VLVYSFLFKLRDVQRGGTIVAALARLYCYYFSIVPLVLSKSTTLMLESHLGIAVVCADVCVGDLEGPPRCDAK